MYYNLDDMKRYIMCLLSFMLFFSSLDLSSIYLLKNIFNDTTKISISDIISVQYEIFEQTKQAFSGICDNIAKDINIILTSTKQTKTYINLYNLFIVKDYLNYCVLLVIPIAKKLMNINLYKDNTKIPLFFFGFIFIFILRYLGLLFKFDGIAISKQYKKAYSM